MNFAQFCSYTSSARFLRKSEIREMDDTFGENLRILKKVSFRGLRAFIVLSVGLTSLWYARKQKLELE